MENEELEALLELREFQFRQKEEQSVLPDDCLICECKCVSVGDIREALLTGKIEAIDLDYLKEKLGLGSGCSSCLKSSESWTGKIL